MTKKKEPRIFESITDKQAGFIYQLIDESLEYSKAEFDAELISLTGLPSIENLSKQEASFLIEKLLGKAGPGDTPFPPRKESALGEGAREMPTAPQISSIRESIKSLGWNEVQFKDWLKQRTGKKNIKDLDRGTAQQALGKLLGLRKQRYMG